MLIKDLSIFTELLKSKKEIIEINAQVDPYLELAEIHRRVIAEEGPALLFKNVLGSPYPVVTNLFGTKNRVDLAFGDEGKKFIQQVAKLPQELLPPNFKKIWNKRNLFLKLLNLGTRVRKHAKYTVGNPNFDKLPIITSWEKDGGPFITLPLVYTEDPETKMHNLGMYRMHKYDNATTGMHMQIGKGGGFHLAKAKELKQSLPVNVFLGGPPALILSAIAPLPENIPELLLCSMLLNHKLDLMKSPLSPLPYPANAEFVLIGSVNPEELFPEGPFGDHYGYYSLQHDFPVFRCKAVMQKKNAIYPATVVGKPRQEDYYIGNYLQELLSPLFPLAMPAVKDLWSYGETGYHSLAVAVVNERYKRESMASAFRILGEGQLSLTKFLLLVDKKMDLQNFPKVLEYILERADFRKDLYIFSNLSMDTLDYTGTKLNEGSKGVLMGIGDPIRKLPTSFNGSLGPEIKKIKVFSPGCLVISGITYSSSRKAAEEIANLPALSEWPLVILADDADFASSTPENFLWNTFTRFAPGTDIYSKSITLEQFHPKLEMPIVIDTRMKPNYPEELFCDKKTECLVSKRWDQYFRNK